ncbi:hypothetical protein [Apilactobacillus micheneri]|nr:hypothetical protein [Apilactobacillus micheneri]GAY80420.1 hypothetical protein NBRC113063_01299 [Apilactobacillus micheneri]
MKKVKHNGSATMIALIFLIVLSIILSIKFLNYNAEITTINELIKNY